MKVHIRMLRPPNYYVVVQHRDTKTVKMIGPDAQKAAEFADQIRNVYDLLGEDGVRQLLAKESPEINVAEPQKPVPPTLADYLNDGLRSFPMRWNTRRSNAIS